MEYFGEDSDSLEISKEGCRCQSCETPSDKKIDIKDDLDLLFNTLRTLQSNDRTEKKVCSLISIYYYGTHDIILIISDRIHV